MNNQSNDVDKVLNYYKGVKMTIKTLKDVQGNDIKVVEYMRIEHHST